MTAGHNMAIFTDCDFFMNSVNFLEVNFPPKTDFVPVFFLSRPHAKTTYISVIKKRLYAEFSLGVKKNIVDRQTWLTKMMAPTYTFFFKYWFL